MQKGKSVFQKNRIYIDYGKSFFEINQTVGYYLKDYGINNIIRAFQANKSVLNENEKQEFTKIITEHKATKTQFGELICSKEEFEGFVSNLFQTADDEDREGEITKKTAQRFKVCADLIDVLSAFGEINKEWKDKSKYCKFKALDIIKSINAGIEPKRGGPKESGQDNEFNELANEINKEQVNPHEINKIENLSINNNQENFSNKIEPTNYTPTQNTSHSETQKAIYMSDYPNVNPVNINYQNTSTPGGDNSGSVNFNQNHSSTPYQNQNNQFAQQNQNNQFTQQNQNNQFAQQNKNNQFTQQNQNNQFVQQNQNNQIIQQNQDIHMNNNQQHEIPKVNYDMNTKNEQNYQYQEPKNQNLNINNNYTNFPSPRAENREKNFANKITLSPNVYNQVSNNTQINFKSQVLKFVPAPNFKIPVTSKSKEAQELIKKVLSHIEYGSCELDYQKIDFAIEHIEMALCYLKNIQG